ncbi:MAG: phytanoyl-CoA dioxygenase family protein [Pseudomonadota bacterium]
MVVFADENIAQDAHRDYWLPLQKAAKVENDASALIALRDARLSWFDKMPRGSNHAHGFRPSDAGALLSERRGKIPEIQADDLEIGVLASAMYRNGALIVRKLVSKSDASVVRDMIDRTLNSAAASGALGEDSKPVDQDREAEWFCPPPAKADRRAHLSFVKNTGSVETFMSPRTSNHLLTLYDQLGLRSLMSAYFSDDVCVSFNKSVLRRVAPLQSPADWHQDGAFMSPNIKSLNVWLALTPCGEGKDAPGLDLVPQRLDEIVETGLNGANFDWSVSAITVRETFPDTPPVRPTFGVGDAIFFDHYNLHATSFGPEFTENRYAAETWFFATNQCPENQNPVYW